MLKGEIMKEDVAFMLAERLADSNWGSEERDSYDLSTLREEYRESLFNEEALELLNAGEE
jgi:hypothetical protein